MHIKFSLNIFLFAKSTKMHKIIYKCSSSFLCKMDKNESNAYNVLNAYFKVYIQTYDSFDRTKFYNQVMFWSDIKANRPRCLSHSRAAQLIRILVSKWHKSDIPAGSLCTTGSAQQRSSIAPQTVIRCQVSLLTALKRFT